MPIEVFMNKYAPSITFDEFQLN